MRSFIKINTLFGLASVLLLSNVNASEPGEIPDDVVKKVDPSVVAIQHVGAVGSGFIISEDGYILTNGHVIRGSDKENPKVPAKSITVVMYDEQKFSATVIGFCMNPDVALIKVDPGYPLQPVEFADSRSVQIGETCFAVGTPVGLKRTFTKGIISNVNRTDLNTFTPVIQTDAAINPGNSGGPLFDQYGRVLGLNTYGMKGNNLGFTIPSHVALVLKDHHMEFGRFNRSEIPFFVGVEMYDELADAVGVEHGILVQYVMKGTTVYKAGLRMGDVIVKVDDKDVSARTRSEMQEFTWDLAIREPGSPVEFTVLVPTALEADRLTIFSVI